MSERIGAEGEHCFVMRAGTATEVVIAREEAVREQLQQSLLLAQAETASLKTECSELRNEIERRTVIHRPTQADLPDEWLFHDTYPTDKCPKCSCRNKRIIQSQRVDIMAHRFDLQCDNCKHLFETLSISEREWHAQRYMNTSTAGGSLTEAELRHQLKAMWIKKENALFLPRA
jgi:Zn finger protein HypA/HybF involved in hydrogenase expression